MKKRKENLKENWRQKVKSNKRKSFVVWFSRRKAERHEEGALASTRWIVR